MSGDVTARLVKALPGYITRPFREDVAAALEPIVRELMAEELEAAAVSLDWVEVALGGAAAVRTQLEDRAAALRGVPR